MALCDWRRGERREWDPAVSHSSLHQRTGETAGKRRGSARYRVQLPRTAAHHQLPSVTPETLPWVTHSRGSLVITWERWCWFISLSRSIYCSLCSLLRSFLIESVCLEMALPLPSFFQPPHIPILQSISLSPLPVTGQGILEQAINGKNASHMSVGVLSF